MKKKELFKIFFGILSIYVITSMVACNNKNDGGGAPIPVPGPAVGVICPSGSTLNNTNGLCYLPNGQIISSTNSSTLDFLAESFNGSLNSSLTITNTS
nr:hypothetical protein [Pseudobdellovibrionaceae bacterium]